MDSSLNIVYITDKNYLAPTYVSVKSLIKSKEENSFYHIIILGRNLEEDDKLYFLELETEKAKILYFDIEDKLSALSQFEQFHNNSKKSALSKLLLPLILEEYNKILYIDGDTYIRKDVSELYDIDIQDSYIAAARDYGPTSIKMKDFLGLKRPYFNSGVMVMNLEEMRKNKICEKLVKAKNELKNIDSFLDQSAYNCVCTNYKEIPMKWNFYFNYYYLTQGMQFFYENCKCPYEDKKQMREDSAIIHFASYKPWTQPKVERPWYKEKLDYNSTFEESAIGNISKEWYTILLNSKYSSWIDERVEELFDKNKKITKKSVFISIRMKLFLIEK